MLFIFDKQLQKSDDLTYKLSSMYISERLEYK